MECCYITNSHFLIVGCRGRRFTFLFCHFILQNNATKIAATLNSKSCDFLYKVPKNTTETITEVLRSQRKRIPTKFSFKTSGLGAEWGEQDFLRLFCGEQN